jgi:tetratricopeptide (TPR) repeat protein
VAVLLRQGRVPEAAALALQGVKARPDDALSHLDLASIHEQQDQLAEALEHTRRAVELAPDHPEARLRLASLLFKLQRHAETIAACREALRLTPTDPEVHFMLACALRTQANSPQASLACSGEETLSCKQADSLSTSEVLIAEAMNHFSLVTKLAPETPEAFNGLAWILATHPRSELRDGREAVKLAERACELTANHDPASLRTLAAAYAEAGRFPAAVETARKGEELAAAAGDTALRQQNRRLAELFLTRHPYRQNPPAEQAK